MRTLVTLSVLLIMTGTTFAIDTELAFEDPVKQQRYETLIAEVRCVTCQNQNIRDSNAFIASDLRREIRRLIGEGKSNEEVADFLVERYGDFVLYRPRVSGAAALLWLAPALFLLIGAIGFVRVIRHRMTLMTDEDSGQTDPKGTVQ